MKSSNLTTHVGLFSQLRPRVNFANYMITEPGQSWGPRLIPDSQLVFLLSGRASLVLGGETHDLGAGQGVFYGADSPHILISSSVEPMTFSSIHFSWDADKLGPVHPGSEIQNCTLDDVSTPARTYLIDVDGYGEKQFPHFYSQTGLDKLFLRMVREYRNEEVGYSVVLRSLLVELLMHILRITMRPETRPEALSKVAPALQAIKNQPHVNWSISTLADLCGYNPNYFCELFRDSVGYSPKHFIMLERIRLAKLLLPTRATVEEVASELGYSSTHYFCRQFKQITDSTPAAYRKQHLEL